MITRNEKLAEFLKPGNGLHMGQFYQKFQAFADSV